MLMFIILQFLFAAGIQQNPRPLFSNSNYSSNNGVSFNVNPLLGGNLTDDIYDSHGDNLLKSFFILFSPFIYRN
uniref:Uncharacterized protein n=1 Tax=Heterorhabditis bacteriophora TaxID=37862 RepID=A0A1I7WX02_HETBA